MISKIGDDILLEILIRLPNPRSACRCKTVCKRWRSVISDHRFNRSFVSHPQTLNKQQTLPLHTDDATDPKSVVMSFLPPMPDRVRECFKVLDCFKDMLLCGFADVSRRNYEIGRSYVVCNPFTKQWMALPLAPEKPKDYAATVTRLVCEPRSSKGHFKLDLGDDEQVFAYSEYRFRVVCIYQHETSIKLDVFCPESGKWMKEAVVYDGYRRLRHKNVCSCNGKLFWLCVEDGEGYNAAELKVFQELNRFPEVNPFLAVFDPFRLDIHTTSIHVYEYSKDLKLDISSSQGALHIIEFERKPRNARLRVWRLEDDHESWSELRGGLLERPSSRCHYEIEHCKILDMHPEKPEVVFFQYTPPSVNKDDAILCCDLRKGELEFVTDLRQLNPRWTFFQPRISCWPSPIPRYEQLRGMYDGSCSWFRAANEVSEKTGTCTCCLSPLVFFFVCEIASRAKPKSLCFTSETWYLLGTSLFSISYPCVRTGIPDLLSVMTSLTINPII
ncbi:unnamed protein product [Linum tenue]|uniref:F-box domain-containing protein n=1 Tax=Linum tenue TaxID=586396 RepID=A0AAV0MVW4_9ROSI|nr:unnamed protein product [Linum tenue]